MSTPSLHESSTLRAQLRAIRISSSKPYNSMPKRTILAKIANHGGIQTMLDQDLVTARLAAISSAKASDKKMLTVDAAGKLRAMVQNFFYKLIEKDGYLIHSELMAYISEPGIGNGVAFDTGADASPTIPAAFTFVGQFIDHDLTFNGINLTEDERGIIVQDKASPLIDLDSVYGLLFKDAVPNPNDAARVQGFKDVFEKIFDENGKFRLQPVGDSFDLCREIDDQGNPQAIIFDPRNDENQLILQIHILVERFHNALIDSGLLGNLPSDPIQRVELVRKEVVATWQHFVLTDYMREIIREEVLAEVIEQINIKATDAAHPEAEYGNLKHKPYKDLITGKNIVRMPHEFAIGFRFGHSQLRPTYKLNAGPPVTLFTNSRQATPNDLRGSRNLTPDHIIDWNVFYPPTETPETQSLKIDHKVTERVFNLPESAIPDDIKYIGNLAHRNLIRSSQIGIVSGEELAGFYGLEDGDVLSPEEVLSDPDDTMNEAVINLFKMSPSSEEQDEAIPDRRFKTPLWYYVIKEGEIHSQKFPIVTSDGRTRNQLGKAGSRLIAEVLAGALYYGNDFPFDNNWISVLHTGAPQTRTFGTSAGAVTIADSFTLREIIEFVNSTPFQSSGC